MISVIIPLYNVEKYIENCLKSFENQKYKNFEIIIVNDGTKDNSANIVKQYIGKSQMKIKLICQENAGVSAARNKGIINAQGKYLCFVDSDDMVVPEYLSEMFDAITTNNYNIVICGTKLLAEECNSILTNYNKQPLEEMKSSEALKKFLFRDISPGVGSFLVESSVIKDNKLSFAEGFQYSEDIEFIFKIFAHSKKIAFTRNQLYLYRIRNTSVMSLVNDKRIDGFILMQGLESYFDQVNPEFAKTFRKFGVARWVWATLWQSILISRNYGDFIGSVENYNPKYYMRKLLNFSEKRVSMSALAYIICPFIYYYLTKKIICDKNIREFSTS